MLENESIDALLYDKSYTCPLCQGKFKNKALRSGKNQLLSVDDDLHPHYALLSPLMCDVIVCPRCGYCVVTKALGPLLPKQKEWLQETFILGKPPSTYASTPSMTQAITQHKMALLASIIKKGKIGEQAYIALHIAWLYRELGDAGNEHSFLQRACTGLTEAYGSESFPIMGIDEPTFTYLLAAISSRLDNLEKCKYYLAIVLTSRNCPSRIKDYARELKAKISEPHVLI